MRVAPAHLHAARFARLTERLSAESLTSLVVTSSPNVAYLTGFFGSAGQLLVTPNEVLLIVDGRYTEAAARRAQELDAINIVMLPQGATYEECLADQVGGAGGGQVGVEASHLTVGAHTDLLRRLHAKGHKPDLVPTEGLVERLRVVKDDWEVATLRDAGARLSDAAKRIIPKALAGSFEHELATAIELELRRVGFAKPAFDTIVASGPNSAMPHYRSGDRRIESGDLVVLDFGGMLDGYCVDLTRTAAVGGPNARQRQVLEQVAEAQASAFEAIVPGEWPETIDERARGVLVREGIGDAFAHGTGHGLGLEVHERPRVGPRRAGQSTEPLEAGMVFTLEPGAYFPGWGGVRIEDDVLVTASGAEWLTHVPQSA
jgi:Xaa-Pro aminopeptidase